MKILYKDTPLSILKAALYSEFTGYPPEREAEQVPALFNETTIDADDIDIEDLITKTRLAKKDAAFFASPQAVKALQELITWALRHGSSKRFAIIMQAVRAGIGRGLLPLLNSKLPEGRALIKLAEEVQGEVRLAGQQMKFTVLSQSDNILSTRHTLHHNTADLVLSSWTKVYPDYTFVLLLPHKTILQNRHGLEEWEPFYGTPQVLARKVATANLLNKPGRSRLANQHASFVQTSRGEAVAMHYTPSVNYVDFYNRIKKGETLI